MSEQDGTARDRVYAEIRGYELTEWQAWVIQRGLTVLLIVAFLQLGPGLLEQAAAKQELKAAIYEEGCHVVTAFEESNSSVTEFMDQFNTTTTDKSVPPG